MTIGEKDSRTKARENEQKRAAEEEGDRKEGRSKAKGETLSAFRAKIERSRYVLSRNVLRNGAPATPAEGVGELDELLASHFRWLPVSMTALIEISVNTTFGGLQLMSVK
jgi:hypothetical protein